jgi:hypothetical protein
MVSVLTSSVVDRGFEPRSVQTKDYEIGMRCFSANHVALANHYTTDEPTIYHTRGEQADHYTTETVLTVIETKTSNKIVMVGVLASSAVDRGASVV